MRKKSRVFLLTLLIVGMLLCQILVGQTSYKEITAIYFYTFAFLWFLGVIGVIRKIVEMDRLTFVFITCCLLLYPSYFILSIFISKIIGKTLGDMIMENGLISVLVAMISIQIVAFYILALNFKRLLEAKSISKSWLIIFLQLVTFPVCIWVYQNKLKEWGA